MVTILALNGHIWPDDRRPIRDERRLTNLRLTRAAATVLGLSRVEPVGLPLPSSVGGDAGEPAQAGGPLRASPGLALADHARVVDDVAVPLATPREGCGDRGVGAGDREGHPLQIMHGDRVGARGQILTASVQVSPTPSEYGDEPAGWGEPEASPDYEYIGPGDAGPDDDIDAEHVVDFDVETCRVCGCTDLASCPSGCEWVGVDLCSACDGGEPPALIVLAPCDCCGAPGVGDECPACDFLECPRCAPGCGRCVGCIGEGDERDVGLRASCGGAS